MYAIAKELPPAEHAVWLAAKELIKVFMYNKHLANSIMTNSNVNSSYTTVYRQYRHIFDDLNKIGSCLLLPHVKILYK